MISPRCITIATLLLLGHGSFLAAGSAPADGAQIVDVEVGLAGHLKVGYWVPVRVTISGGATGFSGHIEITAPDGDDLEARFVPSTPEALEVAAGQQWAGWRYVKLGRVRGAVRIALRDAEGQVIAKRTARDLAPHPATWQWVVTIGTDMGVRDAAVFLARMRDERVVSSVLTKVTEFPDQWFGYEGVSVLLVPTGTESLLERLSEHQFAALMQWLRLGGRMILSAGHRADKLFAIEHRFHIFRPGTFVEFDEYWKASGLENFAHAAERVQVDKASPLAVFSELRGRILCLEGAGGTDDRALVTQYPVGLGSVTYVALDLDLPPLAGWPARPRLLARLLQTRSEDDGRHSDQDMRQVTHVGFNDLSGQLRAALDQFPGVTLVHFSWIAALLVAYILMMGPIDFFGLRRLGRPQWTWVTFPLIVILFCGIAVWLSRHLKGSVLEVNHVDIVDIDLADQLVRGTTWASIYSPDTTTLSIAVKPVPTWPKPDATTDQRHTGEVLLSWQGLPGSGLGGMNTTTAVDVLRAEYRVRYPRASNTMAVANGPKGPQLEGLPIHTASSKGIVARWTATTSLRADGKLVANSLELLEGVVTNPLDVKLSHCQVCYQNWVYTLERPLAPGASARLGNSQPLDLRWRLTRRSVVGAEEIGSAWQTDDLSDVDRILEILMFYGAAGGRTYTGLSHNYQGFVDLSGLLHSGRAILVGRSKQPASQLRLTTSATADDPNLEAAGKQRHWTYYRIVIPVHVPD